MLRLLGHVSEVMFCVISSNHNWLKHPGYFLTGKWVKQIPYGRRHHRAGAGETGTLREAGKEGYPMWREPGVGKAQRKGRNVRDGSEPHVSPTPIPHIWWRTGAHRWNRWEMQKYGEPRKYTIAQPRSQGLLRFPDCGWARRRPWDTLANPNTPRIVEYFVTWHTIAPSQNAPRAKSSSRFPQLNCF